MKRFWLLILVIGFGFSRIPTASAHGLEAGQMSVLIDNVNAAVIIAPYASAFPFADENGDGLLSAEEVNLHEEAIHALVSERVVLRNEAGEAAAVIAIDAAAAGSATSEGEQAGADFVQISMQVAWQTVPEVVDVAYTLFGEADTSMHFFMLDNDSETKEVLEGTFDTAVTVTRLRGEGTPTQSGSAIWLTGIEHVLSGYDHILFILALVLATAGLRKLLVPLTAFTLAHTITLAAVAFGFEPPIPPWLIEATIAASIAILAGIYLFGITVDVWWVAALLGLVHGLGFGQALTASLGSLQQWGSTLIAITIGVELTHLAIALLGLGALQLIRQPSYDKVVRRLASVAILCVGLYWTFERIPL
jgi:hypothetical protein